MRMGLEVSVPNGAGAQRLPLLRWLRRRRGMDFGCIDRCQRMMRACCSLSGVVISGGMLGVWMQAATMAGVLQRGGGVGHGLMHCLRGSLMHCLRGSLLRSARKMRLAASPRM